MNKDRKNHKREHNDHTHQNPAVPTEVKNKNATDRQRHRNGDRSGIKNSHKNTINSNSNDNSGNNDKDININDIIDAEVSGLLKRPIHKSKTILVLSGGSTKGVAQIGALHCLKEHNLLNDIKTIAATSAGSMVGLLYCAGYNPLELYRFIKLIDLEMVKKLDAHNVITKYGLDDGSRMMLVLKKLLNAKGYDSDITFDEFFRKTGLAFIVTGACLNDKKVYYFSHKSHPQMKVIEAIRISISIPIIFTPCEYEGKLFVDGGCIDNFPISLFDDDMDRVIGVYVSEHRKIIQDIKYIEDYLGNIIQCLFEGMTHRDTKINNRCVITIRCSMAGDSPVDIVNMFDEGYEAADKKIKSGGLS
jgi:predicted acylesterase/phospholipase RssA